MTINFTTATTVTAEDLITRAARALAYLGRTESIGAADVTDALEIFNAMLDSWSTEGLAAYVYALANFPLVINKQTYTIGPSGADVTAGRPFVIEQAFVRDSNNLDYPLDIIQQDQWNNIGLKTNTSQIPNTLFYQTTYPNGQINIFPIPTMPYSLYYVDSLSQVPFSLLTQTLAMPLGYERAYVTNLALELMAHGFPCMLSDRQLAVLVNTASDARANVKRSNMKEVVSEVDPAIVSVSRSTYNVYSDSNPRR